MNKLKFLISGIVFIVFLAQPHLSMARGGDLGGGGNVFYQMQNDFRLDTLQLEQLRQKPSVEDSFVDWANSLTPEQQEVLFEKVFEHHILPQIVE